MKHLKKIVPDFREKLQFVLTIMHKLEQKIFFNLCLCVTNIVKKKIIF